MGSRCSYTIDKKIDSSVLTRRTYFIRKLVKSQAVVLHLNNNPVSVFE